MKETRLYQRLAKLKAYLAPMSWPKRIEHICIYYGHVILITMLSIFVAASLLVNLLEKQNEIIMGGLLVNVSLSEQGNDYINEDYRDALNISDKHQKVDVTLANMTALTDAENAEMNYYVLTKTIAMMTDHAVDYLIVDKTALEIYLSHEVFLDLNLVFTQEELAALGNKVITLSTTNDNGETVHGKYPVAIDISDLQFVQECANHNGPVYIGFVANGSNSQRYHDFWEYLNAWQMGD